jgi:hypothetical protein
MHQNHGSLIVLARERVLRILEAASDEREEDDDVKGLGEGVAR